jgi:PIN domain nuclease of toxin-antitoxin system
VNILLDTQIWLWSFLEKRRIRKGLTEALEDPENQLWLSPVSVWEAMVLFQRGKIQIASDPGIWIRQALAKGFVAEAALTHEIALHSRLIELPHQDPADRFIAATALVRGFALATSDKHLLRCRGIHTLPNR